MPHRIKIILLLLTITTLPSAGILAYFYHNHAKERQTLVGDQLQVKANLYRDQIDTILELYTILGDRVFSQIITQQVLGKLRSNDYGTRQEDLNSILQAVLDPPSAIAGIEIEFDKGRSFYSGKKPLQQTKRLPLQRGETKLSIELTPENELLFSYKKPLRAKDQVIATGTLVFNSKRLLGSFDGDDSLTEGSQVSLVSTSKNDFKLLKGVDLQASTGTTGNTKLRAVATKLNHHKDRSHTLSKEASSRRYLFKVKASSLTNEVLAHPRKVRNQALIISICVTALLFFTLIKLYSPIFDLSNKAKKIVRRNTRSSKQNEAHANDLDIIGEALELTSQKILSITSKLEEKKEALKKEIETNARNEESILKMNEDLNVERQTLNEEIKLREAAQTTLNSAVISTQKSNGILKNTLDEKIKIETELFDKSNMLAAIVECMAEGLIFIDLSKNVKLMNPSARRILGIDHSKSSPKEWECLNRLLDPDDKNPVPKNLLPDALIASGKSVVDQEYYCQSLGDHPSCYININATPVTNMSGELVACVMTFNDISDKRKYLDHLSQMNEELRRSNIDLDDFAYAASHDLKSPLRGIDNLAKWLQEDYNAILPKQALSDLDSLRSRTQRMEYLLEALLEYTKAGQEQEEPQASRLCPLVEGIYDQLEKPAEFKFSCKCPSTPFKIKKQGLATVLKHLLSNAIRHRLHDNGSVEVIASPLGSHLSITVHDDGPGIPLDQHDKVFAIFKTLKPRDELETTGMGLAISKKVILKAGGDISICSTDEKKGSCFCFTWPIDPSMTLTQEGHSDDSNNSTR